MHYLLSLSNQVNKTHGGLGNAVAFAAVCAKANKCLLIVAPQGTGKSTVINILASIMPDNIKIPEVTRTGMQSYSELLQGSQSLVHMDDLGATDTSYTRMQTVLTMAELCYAHTIGKQTAKSSFTISDFNGSFVTSIQPVLMRPLIQTTQWESNLQDKVVRYYHLYRPLKVNLKLPEIRQIHDGKLRNVREFEDFRSLPPEMVAITDTQWGTARAQEHTASMLRACALLDERNAVNKTDVETLLKVMKPMVTEKWAIRRYGIEEKREVDLALIYLMTEWATYGDFTLAQLMHDHKLIQSVAYKVMEKSRALWTISQKKPTTYLPSDRPLWSGENTSMLTILADCGIEIRGNNGSVARSKTMRLRNSVEKRKNKGSSVSDIS